MQIELTSPRIESDPLSADRRGALERALERTRKEAAALESLSFLPRSIHLMCDQSASSYSATRNEIAALRKPRIC